MITITKLAVYPVKSLGQVGLKCMSVGRTGPRDDRRWMVVDQNRRFISQRECPAMAQIRVVSEPPGYQIILPDGETCSLQKRTFGGSYQVQIWNDIVDAQVVGGDIAGRLSEFLGKACSLVEFTPTSNREVNQVYASPGDQVAFADGFPFLLVSEASLASVNSLLEQKVSMRRFRPNIVVDGCEAFAEDSWQAIKVGNIVLDITKPCSRCVIPSLDPDTGEKHLQLSRVLSETRRRDGKVFFGQNAIHRGMGEISVGDKVELIE